LLCEGRAPLTELYPRTFREDQLTPAVFSARRTADHLHYRTVRCTGCGLVFAAESLPPETLASLYGNSEVTFDDFGAVLRRDYWRPLAAHPEIERGSALEIGCSYGFFLEELKAQGFRDVTGCEPSRAAKEKADPRIRGGIHSILLDDHHPFARESFNLVCSFHTLDHAPDPLGFLKICWDLVAPGGWVYMVVHDVEALQAKILGERSPIIDIEHVYLFSKSTLRRLFEKVGFQSIEVNGLKNSYPLRYWLKMTPLPSGLRSLLMSAARGLGLQDWSPAWQAGNLYILARKPARVKAS